MKKIYIVSIFATFYFTTFSQSTTLVISQVYGGGGNSGATYTHDFIEIFNKSASSINLSGYSVQYASAAGTTWQVTNLTNVSLAPGQYYLIQEAVGAGAGVALPTPDVTGAISMGATGGKVALVNNTTALTGNQCTQSASVIDFVGYGSATCYEGTGPTAAPSAANSVFRKLNGCQDTQDNTTDFSVATASARNTSSTFNVCSGSCTTPTQGASLMRYKSSTANSMDLLFNRGNGTGAIVLCKAGSAVNATPASGTTYTANATFGSGSQIGTGNYVVHSTTLSGTVGFTVSGLTNGTKYYFSVFEYNDPGKCYTTTGLVDSFTVGATVLKPGDMVFIGWDNNAVSGGEDKLYLMNMIPIAKGTKFTIVNSRFEAGAAANVRTNKWYGGSSDPYQNPDMQEFEYAGSSSIASGSVISMESNGTGGFTNFTINGVSVPAADFSAKTGTSNFLSNTGTDADQLYIVQGKFTPYGTTTVDRYNTLDGLVIHGFTTRVAWVPLSSAVSAANTGGNTRQSRIPPDILCINTEFSNSANNFAYYITSTGTAGTKNLMLSRLKNTANWVNMAGNAGSDDVIAGDPSFNTTTYTINSPKPDGDWNGTVSTDWFDCNNWEGLHVPDSTLTVSIFSLSPAINNCTVDVTGSTKATEYSNVARAGYLNVLPAGILSLSGTGAEKIIVEDSLKINLGGRFQFENNTNAATDSLQLHGSFIDEEPDILTLGFQAGQGVVDLKPARFTTSSNYISKQTNTQHFYKLAMNNSRSTNIINPISISNNLNLQSGYLTISTNGQLTLTNNATITSPVNVYGQINKGYQSSFVNGKMYIYRDATIDSADFPIGKIVGSDTIFAPVKLKKGNSNSILYDAEYFYTAYNDLTVDVGQLKKVSAVEHWLINANTTGGDAKVTLSWRPQSQVGDGIAAHDAEALDSLCLAHYFNDGSSTRWRIDGYVTNTNPGFTKTGDVNYGLITTNINTSSFSPFTLGGKSDFNLLPVKILRLYGYVAAKNIEVKWQVKDEQLVKHYEIEKSTDGVHFTKIEIVNAANTGNSSYSVTDNAPVNGYNYYRLKVTDALNKISYSYIIKVQYGVAGNVQVYPNPAKNNIIISLPQLVLQPVIIINAMGAVVKKINNPATSFAVDISTLPAGIYFVKTFTGNKPQTVSFIKQ